ncbi:hypothetical protein U0355_13085 [Salimicrobium sp. PL1-032A]|uniref:hypothetical protein n=1 Tax=Salimicrobium sp. PL1-032A TaxID=3095364 RepID=UPI0032605CD0
MISYSNENIELIKENEGDGEGDMVLLKNAQDYNITYKKTEKQKDMIKAIKEKDEFQKTVGGFTRMLTSTLIELHNDNRFTDIEKARLIYLGTYTSYEDSGRYLRFGNNQRIQKKHLQEVLDINNRNAFYGFYNKLIEHGILAEEKVKKDEIYLVWNSFYAFKGSAKSHGAKSEDTVKAYDQQVQAMYKAKNDKGKPVNRPKQLYIMFMIMPFIHIKTNALCKYPRKEIEEAEPLQLKELAEMFGFEKPHQLKNKLMDCTLYGTNVFAISERKTTEGKKYTRIFISPYVASRTGDKPDPHLIAMFPDVADKIRKEKAGKRKRH